MKTELRNTSRSLAAGFSGWEMLGAMAVMMLICLSVIPVLMCNATAREAAARSDARWLTSLSYEAQLKGVDFVSREGVTPTLINLQTGGSTPNGRRFQASGLTPAEAQAAAEHLTIRQGRLQLTK